MPSNVDLLDQTKIGLKLVADQIRQHRLTTAEKTIVDTTYGPVKGIKRKSIYGQYYCSFEGIPFAKPPVGELRFKAPQPPEPWTKPKNCTTAGPKPLQKHVVFQMNEGSEDCLYLNVYTKNVNPTKPLPVMVWIYGGGFQFGEASRTFYGPDYLMRENVVVITINYRLGALGFLSLDDPNLDVPGNAGLKDQVLGLQWVKSNCDRFGGDPDNITVFGQSAGGASTHYMMLTERTKNLFHKAIIMSGTALAPWALSPPRNWAHRLADAIGYEGEHNDRAVFEFLSKAKGWDIIKYSEILVTDEEKQNRIGYSFGPVIEPYLTKDCVIPRRPHEMMRDAWSNKIPLIIGGVSGEGLLLYAETKKDPKILNETGDCEYVVPYELGLDRSSEVCKDFGMQIKRTYFEDKGPCLDTLFEYLHMVSHEYFWFPVRRTVLSRLKHATAPTYLYRFDVDSKYFNHMRIVSCGRKIRGVCHGDDLSYLFCNSIANKLKKHSKEYQAIERVISLWTHFATTGNPNNMHTSEVVWQPVESPAKAMKCLNISDSVEIIDLPEEDKLGLWDTFFSPESFI